MDNNNTKKKKKSINQQINKIKITTNLATG